MTANPTVAERGGTPSPPSIERADTGLRTRGSDWFARARRHWPATLALLFLLAIGILATAPNLFHVPDPLLTTPRDAFLGPSRAYLFGTDDLGRDLFSRTIYGARVSLGTAIVVVIAAAGIGVPVGLVAGYREGIVDALVMR